VFENGIPPLISELQNGHRREALRHRGDAEHSVGSDRGLRRNVAESDRADVRRLTLDDDAPGGAGDVLLGREVGEETIDVSECGRELRAIGLRRRRRPTAADESGGHHAHDDASDDHLAPIAPSP
jgi:hypothetical protein